MKRILPNVAFAFCSITLLAQEIPVNIYTGTPGISINLYTLTDFDLSESLSMSYNVNGVNLNSAPVYGTGWNLEVGGQVSRQVRGLPDDFSGFAVDSRRGWLYNSNFSQILQFHGTASLTASTCDNFQDDYNYINNLQYNIDTEPDIFSFSAGGYSGKFVFDNTGNVQLIPYQDLLITPHYRSAPNDMTITGWTITTNTGLTYTFNETCPASRVLTRASTQLYLNIFEKDANQYSTVVNYTSAWMLSTAQSHTGATLTYSYKVPPQLPTASNNDWNVQLYNPSATVTRDIFIPMTESTTFTGKIVSKVVGSSGKRVECDPIKGIQIYDPARGTRPFKQFSFEYKFGNFLHTITESDGNSCISMPPYVFWYNLPDVTGNGRDFWGYYNGATNTSNGQFTDIPTIYIYPNEPAAERFRLYPIPSYVGTQITLTGDANRTPDPTQILWGTLARLVYPTGGEADFVFESNQYFDSRAGNNQYGGGLRIKSITQSDGVNPSSTMVKNFSYVDSLGRSTGKLITRPSFVFPLWQQKIPTESTVLGNSYTAHSTSYSSLSGNAVWQDLIAVTNWDISDQQTTNGSAVGYSHATVSRPGSGSAVYDYLVPAAYGDPSTGSASTDWSPTLMKFARPTSCPVMGIVSTGENYGLSTMPQIEYDYERGLVWKKTEKNNSNAIVRQTLTNYQYIYKPGLTQPTKVTGLAYDLFGNANNGTNQAFLYGSYNLLANVAKVVSSEAVTTYDENSNRQRYATSTNQYTYPPPSNLSHRLPIQVTSTTADGTKYSTYLTYAADYSATNSQADNDNYMIYLLQQARRTSTVIEQRNTITPPGAVETITGASLTKFNAYSFGKPLAKYRLAFRPSSPVAMSGFTPSYIDGTHAFVPDPKYKTVQTINEYDQFELPISATGENNMTAGTLLGYGGRLPVVQFTQAQSTNIAFSDFETNTLASLNASSPFYGTGRTGAQGVHPYGTFSRTLSKPSGTAKYLLAFWVKPAPSTTSIYLQLTVKDGNGNVVSTPSPFQFTYNSASSDYQYFTQSIDISMVPSTFMLQLQWLPTLGQSFAQPSGSVGSFNSGLLPMLDDVAFYPEYSNLSSVTYDIPYGPNSTTSASGNTVYTTYDFIGRAKWTLDQDHNIRKRNTYSVSETIAPFSASLDSIVGKYVINTPIMFVAYNNPCYSNVTFSWSTDGTNWTSPSSSPASPFSQTYSTTGSKSVYLKVSNGLTTVQSQLYITVGDGVSNLSVTIASTGVDGTGFQTLNATVTDATVPPLPVTYTWYQRPSGTSNWIQYDTSSSSSTQRVLPDTSLEFKCVISTGDGRVATSNFLVVANK